MNNFPTCSTTARSLGGPKARIVIAGKTIAISGGFDPLHHGHIRMIEAAKQLGDVIAILNSDEWLRRKKGYNFMKWEHRAEILRAIGGVKEVVSVDDADGTVCEALERIKPDYFANGGDRTEDNTPELRLCEVLGITPLFGIGGEKVASSSELVGNVPPTGGVGV